MRTLYLVSVLFATACTTDNSDPSVYLTGTEESYVINAQTGAKDCLGHKQLICHIPPGNPDNAHTICVGKPAVDPHVAHHGDGIGACATEPTDPPSDPPAGGDGSPIL
jgi:hypothetical protein